MRLPVVGTGVATVRAVLTNPTVAFRLCWAWIIVFSTGSYVALRITEYIFGSTEVSYSDLFENPGIWPVAALWLAMFNVMLSSIAVGWHRHQLLGEAPQWLHVRMNAMVWRYAGLLCLITVPEMTIEVVKELLFPGSLDRERAGTFDWSAQATAWFVIYVVVAGLVARLSLGLPAGALGSRISIRQSWARTRGNSLRFIVLTACLQALLEAIFVLLNIYFQHPLNSIEAFVGSILAVTLLCLVGVSLLTETYRRLVRSE